MKQPPYTRDPQGGRANQQEGGQDTRSPSPAAAGKRTRTAQLAADRGAAGASAPIQRKVAAGERDDAGSGGPTSPPGLPTEDWSQVALRPDLFAQPIQAMASGQAASGASAGADSPRTLPDDVLGKMEKSLGADFSSVELYEGPQAESMGALAYAQGSEIHFAPGQLQPDTEAGQEILGHEFVHLEQQRAGRVAMPHQAKGAPVNADPALEDEADRLGKLAARGEPAPVPGATPGGAAAGSRAPVQRIASETLDALTEQDAEQNQAATREAAYLTACNELGAEVPGTEQSAKERLFNLKTAYDLGFDFIAFLKDLNQKHGGSDKVTRINAAATVLQGYLATVVAEFEGKDSKSGISALMATLKIGNPTDSKNPDEWNRTEQEWVFEQLLSKGYSTFAIDKALKNIYAQERSNFLAVGATKEAQLGYILGYLKKQEPAKKVVLNPDAFGEEAYEQHGVDPLVIASAERARQSGSTIEANPYVQRHFTPAVMQFLADHADMPIYIYEGAASGALGDIARLGFTELRPLSDNAVTDFRKFTARDPESGKAVFIVVGPSGRAYQREIAAHFLYYDPPVDPNRILHKTKGPDAAKNEFVEELKQLSLDPDIVLMGNVEELRSKLGTKGIKPVREILSPNLYGVLYGINDKAVLSLKVEPHLYADRAGQFLEALQAQSSKQRAVIFTGTAGGFEDDMQINDLIAPRVFSQSDRLVNEPVDGVENRAVNHFNQRHKGAPGMFSGKDMQHGSVDSILFEDNAWLEAHRKGDENHLALIEQEVAGLANAVDTSRTALYAFFRISDLPGKQDFNENETNRPPPRTPVSQGDLMVAMMEEVLQANLSNTGQAVTAGKASVSQKSQELIFQTAEHIYTIATESYEILGMVDAKLQRALMEGVRELIALIQAKKLTSEEFATKLVNLHELYGLVPQLDRQNPPTQFRCKYEGPGPLKVVLRSSEMEQVRTLEEQSNHFWAITTSKPGKGTDISFELVVPGKKASITGTFKGGATKFVDLTS